MNNFDFNLTDIPATVQIPKEIALGLSRMLYEFGVDGDDAVNMLIKYYILLSRDNSDTLASICTNTGFSQHIVKKFLQDSELKPSKKKKMYYRSLVQGLKDLSERLNGEAFTIRGKYNSFLSVYNNCSEGAINTKEISPTAVCERLIKIGILESVGKKVRFLSTKQRVGCANMHTALKEFADTINRMAYTICHNIKQNNNEDTLFQSTYFTTLINPDNHSIVNNLLRVKLRECFSECVKIIDDWEEVEPFAKKLAQSQSKEIGVSFFAFNNIK